MWGSLKDGSVLHVYVEEEALLTCLGLETGHCSTDWVWRRVTAQLTGFGDGSLLTCLGLETGRCSPVWVWGRLAAHLSGFEDEPLQNGQHEGGRLAGTGGRAAADVAAQQRHRHRGRLDRRRVDVLHRSHRLQRRRQRRGRQGHTTDRV